MEINHKTTDENKRAESPVLASSSFKRKLLIAKCSRKKAKLRLSDRFGDELIVSDGPSESSKNSTRSDVNKSVDAHEGVNEKVKEKSSSANVLSVTEHHKAVGFQTASGKPLFNKEESSDFASKLMGEFLNPVAVSFRENKYSFLSKNSVKGNSKSESTKCENISRFLGFEVDEYRYSLKRVRTFHEVIPTTILSGILGSIIIMQNSEYLAENDSLQLHMNVNNKNTYTEPKKVDNSNNNIDVLQMERNSICLDKSSLDASEIIPLKKGFQKAEEYIEEKNDHLNDDLASYNINKKSKTGDIESINSISLGVKGECEIIEEIEEELNVPQLVTNSKESIPQNVSDMNKFENAFPQSCIPKTFSDCLKRENSNDGNREIINNVEIGVPQFATASGKKIQISSNKLSKIHNIFKDIPDFPDNFSLNSKISGTHTEEGSETYKKNYAKVNSEKNSVRQYIPLKVHNESKDFKSSSFEQQVQRPVVTNNLKMKSIVKTEKCAEKITSLFSTASGKTIDLPSSSLEGAGKIFKDIADLQQVQRPVVVTNDFQTKSTVETEKCFEKITSLFSTASGKTIDLPSSSLAGVGKIFKDIPDFEQQAQRPVVTNNLRMKSTANTEKCTEKITSLFSTASGKTIDLPSSSLAGVGKIFKDIPDFGDIKTNEKCIGEIASPFSTASGKTLKVPSSSLSGIQNIFKDVPGFSDMKTNNKEFSSSMISKTADESPHIPHTEMNNTNENNSTPLKKTTIQENGSKPFEFEDKIKQDTDAIIDEKNDNINYNTPQRSLPKKRRLGSSISKSDKISEVAINRAKSLFGDINFDDLKLPSHLKFGSPSITEVSFTPKRLNQTPTPRFSSTPIKTIPKNDSFLNEAPPQAINQRFLIQKPKPANLEDLEELRRQRRILEKKLDFVIKKENALRMQIDAECSKKIIKLEPPVKKNKINLKDVKSLEVQSDCIGSINGIILQINPQNAALIHFSNNWYEVPTVTTEDDCTLVPNRQGLIGISEIEPAFSNMPGIEKNLIPEGWIKNHYRWIVWKLASYERFFPATLRNCFTVDNVIKQLKYRYCRELYNAERPALRKIYEKDDIPQKRMILCISNIIKNGDGIELELTDGWYSIRTIVDDPLCHQLNNKKIKIGSKLIISGAEVLNCEGCHPLELEEAQKVRLKINFNSTRRAAWCSKLGYQRDPSPLWIKLSSAVWNGGNIGRITVYIMRIYPVIYREKTEATVFWRNQNAEYKKIQEYENECLNKYEEDGNVNIIRRNVCPLLQMTVIDVSENIQKPFKFTIWESTDSHQEQLKENQVVACYNLTLRCNGELSTNKKSYFQPFKHDTVKYGKYRRKCVELASYQIMQENAMFGEFDTVGYIVKTHIEQNSQYFWLTDLRKNFLLVKINDGPNHCLLLNKVEEEYLVAVCNLTLNSSRGEFVTATAGFQTIITQYPQYDFLRNKMEELGKNNTNELQSKLRENRKIIDNFENGNKGEITSHSSESEGNTLNFSRVTSTDAVMSMINIDEIVSKHTM